MVRRVPLISILLDLKISGAFKWLRLSGASYFLFFISYHEKIHENKLKSVSLIKMQFIFFHFEARKNIELIIFEVEEIDFMWTS